MTSQPHLIRDAVERNGGYLYSVAFVRGWDALTVRTDGYVSKVSATSTAVTEQGIIGFLPIFGTYEDAQKYADEYCDGAQVFTLNDGRQFTNETPT